MEFKITLDWTDILDIVDEHLKNKFNVELCRDEIEEGLRGTNPDFFELNVPVIKID